MGEGECFFCFCLLTGQKHATDNFSIIFVLIKGFQLFGRRNKINNRNLI